MDIYSTIKDAVILAITDAIRKLTSKDLALSAIDTEGRYAFAVDEQWLNDALLAIDLPQEVNSLWISCSNDMTIHSDVTIKGMHMGIKASFTPLSFHYDRGKIMAELKLSRAISIDAKNMAAKLAKGMIENKINEEIAKRGPKYGVTIKGNHYFLERQFMAMQKVELPYLGEKNLLDLFIVEDVLYQGKEIRGKLLLQNLM